MTQSQNTAAVVADLDLPPLPEPAFLGRARGGLLIADGFTAEQYREGQRAAVAAFMARSAAPAPSLLDVAMPEPTDECPHEFRKWDLKREDYDPKTRKPFAAQPAEGSALVARDWTEDFAHENGNYENHCGTCGARFMGHKRRTTCKVCAAPERSDTPAKFQRGDDVRKTKGSQWSGKVVGTYSTELTPEGYAVESSTERGSVQIYPAAALELAGKSVAASKALDAAAPAGLDIHRVLVIAEAALSDIGDADREPAPARESSPWNALTAEELERSKLPNINRAVRGAILEDIRQVCSELDADAERRAFEEWALAQRVAYRDEQHGLCWYNAGSGAHQWIGWQARARATVESAPASAAPDEDDEHEPMSNHSEKGFPCLCCAPSNSSPVGAEESISKGDG